MKVENILTHHTATPDNISQFREMLLDEYFPKFVDFPSEKIVEKSGMVLHEMVYLHSLLSLEVNPDFEIWKIAEWLSCNRYLNYSFLSGKCDCCTAFEPLAAYLGKSIYGWCRTHIIDKKTEQTLLKLFESVPWERG